MRAKRVHGGPREGLGVGTKLFVSLFAAVFFVLGCVLLWTLATNAVNTIKTWTWQRTDCEIIAGKVVETTTRNQSAPHYAFNVEYAYTFNGQSLISYRHGLADSAGTDYHTPAQLAEKYPPGSHVVCYVNPAAPADAVLERGNLAMLLLLLFPVPFIGIGGGLLYFVWFAKPAPDSSGQEEAVLPPENSPREKSPAHPVAVLTTQAISESPRRGRVAGGIGAGLFSLVFLLLGGGCLYLMVLQPLREVLAARQWPTVPCVVLSSTVARFNGQKGFTYAPDILFRYTYQGKIHQSNTYDFGGGSSSGSAGKQAVVDQYPRGRQTVCYVNPADPTQAVLNRGFSSTMLFGLIPLVFVLIGGAGLVGVVRKARQGAGGMGAAPSAVPNPFPRGIPDTFVLKPDAPRWAKLAAMLGVMLFWNGIVSVFIVQIVSGWPRGGMIWFEAVFMIPFVLIGLMLVKVCVVEFLALFNPRPRLTISPGAVHPGETLRVQWAVTGRTGSLHDLRLRLVGREEATSGGGRSRTTAQCNFASCDIARASAPGEIQFGEATVTLPAGSMHSFKSPHNEISWAIIVHGKMEHGPDLDEEYPVAVLPAARE